MDQYLPILTMTVLATLFVALSFLVSGLFSPRKPNVAKTAPYECGIVPTQEPSERFPVGFYIVAMLFIIFDIEIIFLYPWAVVFPELGLYGLIAMAVFGGLVFISLLYEIAMGGLEWGPINRRRFGPSAPTLRTSTSTVRRVSKSEEAAA
jgi:NADH-quinone oxidoreductase subunit A